MGVLDAIISRQIKFLNSENEMVSEYPSYCEKPERNLIADMGELAKKRYKEGSGAEMKPRGKKPPKMASVRSSSAMTFNLLGNDAVFERAYRVGGSFSSCAPPSSFHVFLLSCFSPFGD